jgi:hypothetical protein
MQAQAAGTTRTTSPAGSPPPKVEEWILRLFGNDKPLGFQAGDANLYRYVGNNPTNATDPSGLQGPGSHTVDLGGGRARVFVEWFPDLGRAEFSVRNNQGQEIGRYVWLRSNPNTIAEVNTHRDGGRLPGISENLMRRISLSLNNQFRIAIGRAGGTWSRALTPAGVRAGFPVNGIMIYGTLRQACQMAGIGHPDYETIDAPYYFTASDGSVFVVREPAWLRSFVTNPSRLYVAGPRAGQSEDITSAQVGEYRRAAEELYGRYEPGGFFNDPRFHPGTERSRVDLVDGNGRRIGYVDESGVHRQSDPNPINQPLY